MSQLFLASNLQSDSKRWRCGDVAPADLATAKLLQWVRASNHFRCGMQGLLYI
jgi:hypothetical protein